MGESIAIRRALLAHAGDPRVGVHVLEIDRRSKLRDLAGTRNGMLTADAILLEYLDEISCRAVGAARAARGSSREEAIRDWLGFGPGSELYELLARCTAQREVRPPTIPSGYASALVRGNFSKLRRVETSDAGVMVSSESPAWPVSRRGTRLAAVVDATMPELPPLDLLVRGAAASNSVLAHALLRFIPHEVARRGAWASEHWTPILRYRGREDLLGRMGMDPGRTRELGEILNWLQHAALVDAKGGRFHGFLLWEETRSRLEITPGGPLTGRARGRLVPVPHRLPRFIGHSHTWAAQASLQLLVLEAMRRDAFRLLDGHGVRLDWNALAEQAEVSREALDEVIEGWLHQDDAHPAFLKRVGGAPEEARWDLAPAYAAERATMVEGARIERARRSRGGRASRRSEPVLRLGRGEQ